MFSGAGMRALNHVGFKVHHVSPCARITNTSSPTLTPQHHVTRLMCSSAASGGFSILQAGSRLGLGSGGLILGSGGLLVYSAATSGNASASGDLEVESNKAPWVQSLAQDSEEMLNPGAMLRTHPIAKVFVDQDHLFETMRNSAQIKEFRCFYEQQHKRFHSVVQLGKDVCGYPQTVHGGLTAAIIDETFGGLGICMWKSGALGVRLPAYTARLEVDYKKKIPAGSLVLCTTEIEKVDGRKVWMRASVTDGKGANTYASARALFVAPRTPGETVAQTVAGFFGGLIGGKRRQKQQE